MIRTAAIALTLLALSLPAGAADDRAAQYFRELDSNGDGQVTPEEFSLNKGAVLYMLDANHDLKIQRKETRLSAEQFDKYAGPDGTLDGGDFFNLPATSFSAFDRNGDRRIDLNEFRQQMEQLRSGQQSAEGR